MLTQVDPQRHRVFYIDGEARFALYFDARVTDPKQIVLDFSRSVDWKFYADLWHVRIEKYKISNDLMRVDIMTAPAEKKTKKEKVETSVVSPESTTGFKDGKWRKCIMQLTLQGASEEVVYEDSIIARTKAEYDGFRKFLSRKPETKEFVKRFAEEHNCQPKYRFTVEKVQPEE